LTLCLGLFAAGRLYAIDFVADPSQELTATSPTGVVAADFNEDGFPDLAFAMSGAAGGDGGFSVLQSNGSGFSSDQPFSDTFAPRAVTAADLNGDNHLDLVAVGFSPGQTPELHIYLGDGSGSFDTPADQVVGVAGFPAGVTAGLFNGDAFVDLVVADSGNLGSALFMAGLGNGTVAAPAPVPAANNTTPDDIVAVDFDDDGQLDFLTPEGAYRGAGDGSFSRVFGLGGHLAVADGDMNNDGHIDAVVLRIVTGTN